MKKEEEREINKMNGIISKVLSEMINAQN